MSFALPPEPPDELKQMRLRDLRREVALGLNSLNEGGGKVYDEETLKELFESIKTEGRKKLAFKKKRAE